MSARAARLLAHLLLDNPQCKQRALTIPLEVPESSAGSPQLLMPRCLANLSAALAPKGMPPPPSKRTKEKYLLLPTLRCFRSDFR